MSQYLSRLTKRDMQNLPSFLDINPEFASHYHSDPRSFAYHDVIQHIPVQKTNHQTASYAYRSNQFVKHAFEDGHMNERILRSHTDLMYGMSDKEAFFYAKSHLNFKK